MREAWAHPLSGVRDIYVIFNRSPPSTGHVGVMLLSAAPVSTSRAQKVSHRAVLLHRGQRPPSRFPNLRRKACNPAFRRNEGHTSRNQKSPYDPGFPKTRHHRGRPGPALPRPARKPAQAADGRRHARNNGASPQQQREPATTTRARNNSWGHSRQLGRSARSGLAIFAYQGQMCS